MKLSIKCDENIYFLFVRDRQIIQCNGVSVEGLSADSFR